MLATLSDRLLYALEKLGITQAELARKINVKPQAINYLCKSKTKKSQLTYDIAEKLGISGEWLATCVGFMKPEDDPQHKLLSSQNRVPVVTLAHIKNCYLKNATSLNNDDVSCWLLTTTDISANGFAIEIQDKAMYPRFDQGTIVIINPEKKPSDKEFILAYVDATDDVVFRQIEFTHKGVILKPMNTAMYKQITLNENDKIIGTLVEARWRT